MRRRQYWIGLLWPAIETAQILRKTYGVSTFVARKL